MAVARTRRARSKNARREDGPLKLEGRHRGGGDREEK
jgi:hypothetical protein